MKEYEVVYEIFNKCPGNQMRDVFVEEVFLEDPVAYVKSRHTEAGAIFEREDLADGTILVHVNISGLLERYTFTEI